MSRAPTAPETVESAYRALTSSAAVRILEDRIVVRMTGDDRVSFLHGMCTGDIKGLAPSAIVRALFLTERAHLIAEFFAWAAEDALLIEIERSQWEPARAHLEHLLVADDVEMEETTLAVIDIEGPKALDAAAAIAGDGVRALKSWTYVKSDAMMVANLPRLNSEAFTILAPRESANEIVSSLCERNSALGVSIADPQALDILRIENGLPRIGDDTDQRTIALEARLEPAISFSKGCYVGQETIERATAHGALKRKLYGLRIEGSRVPGRGVAIMLENKDVGRLTSVACSPRFGIIGLAILHHSAWTEGTQVTLKDAAATAESIATVSQLPFK